MKGYTKPILTAFKCIVNVHSFRWVTTCTSEDWKAYLLTLTDKWLCAKNLGTVFTWRIYVCNVYFDDIFDIFTNVSYARRVAFVKLFAFYYNNVLNNILRMFEGL